MSAWWVNHKQTHKQETDGGYLWSPKADKNGARNQTYLNMPRTEKGETVFSYAFGEIKAIGKIAGTCTDAPRPTTFGETGEQWPKDGWLVPVEWIVLSNPISPRAHWPKIAPLVPEKYSPIRAPGIGNQKFYLTEIDEALVDVLLRLIRQSNRI